MAKDKLEKTNALRLLDRMRIPYEALSLIHISEPTRRS